jgi:hypothetical protein
VGGGGVTAQHGDPVYSLRLLRDTAWWSVPVAVAVALAGSAFTRDLRFGASCLVGAGADIGTLVWALFATRDLDPQEALLGQRLAVALVGRVTAKALLLVGAAEIPAMLSLLGMTAGVLVVDLTLATAGSVAAAYHTFRPHGSGG